MKHLKLCSLFVFVSLVMLSCSKDAMEAPNANPVQMAPVSPNAVVAFDKVMIGLTGMSIQQQFAFADCASQGTVYLLDCHGNRHNVYAQPAGSIGLPNLDFEIQSEQIEASANMDDCVGETVQLIVQFDANCYATLASGTLHTNINFGDPWLVLMDFSSVGNYNPCAVANRICLY